MCLLIDIFMSEFVFLCVHPRYHGVYSVLPDFYLQPRFRVILVDTKLLIKCTAFDIVFILIRE